MSGQNPRRDQAGDTAWCYTMDIVEDGGHYGHLWHGKKKSRCSSKKIKPGRNFPHRVVVTNPFLPPTGDK